MAISLEKRLKDKEDEIIRTVKSFGWSEAMDLYGVRDPLAFWKWLERHGGSWHTPLPPDRGYSLGIHDNYIPLLDRVEQRVEDTISRLKAQLAKKDEVIKVLNQQLEIYRLSDHERYAKKLLKLLELCEA